MDLPVIRLSKPAKEVVRILVDGVELSPKDFELQEDGMEILIQAQPSWPEDVAIRVEYHPR